ncbi:L10-interacting MYB domain-containing protein isoform X2 [Tripterygium wilfordii]|uniref:L10-interacting MYB domain-containing protein isoform X2 n=1 Tax=Tripterygium wilfordii TaxID=458696 RepID=UPI0018F812C8|nr:L10-interacting MYB domain-containing protein isoform X2 [Tripterygium wilfordii]
MSDNPNRVETITVQSMGKRAENGGDRLRTIWTPEMDRFFINLMLQQISKGNKFDDHLFSKRAWKQMSALFNSNFKFQYEKDVLKNRYKTLRNLYRAVKKLLDQEGFIWDERRQMVTAENNVWDEYIKLHPDARSFRIKTIPYYNDLCLIYGKKTAEGKGDTEPQMSEDLVENKITTVVQPQIVSEASPGALNEFKDAEAHQICSSKGVADTPNVGGSSTRSRTFWQPPMDRYFIDIMLEQLVKGNQIDGVFPKHAWMEMMAAFNAKFGFNYDVDILKNRYKTLRRQHNAIKNLLEVDGFIWDETRQMVTADDSLWQDYIKTHTDVRQFMTRPVPYYKDLCLICGDSNVGENDGFSIQNLELQNGLQFEILCEESMSHESLAATSSSEDEADNEPGPAYGDLKADIPNRKTKSKPDKCSPSPKKLRAEDWGWHTALREMTNAVYSLADEKKIDENSKSASIETAIKAVQALPDMDEDLILDACDLLEDETKARTFLALEVKLRKKWLSRKLRPLS